METMISDPKEFCHLIDDVCGQQKSSTVKTKAAQLLCALSENVTGFYSQMMTFAMDAINRSLKDHLPTNLSFTASYTDDAMNESQTTHSSEVPKNGGQQNPESSQALNVLFSDPELEKLFQMYNLKFKSSEELIEVCLVSLASTAHLLQ